MTNNSFDPAVPATILDYKGSKIQTDQLHLTRKHIGDFIDYYHTDPEIVGDIDLIWIKTTIYINYCKISAYGKTFDSSVGDWICLKPTRHKKM
jgi:hypothetical protein